MVTLMMTMMMMTISTSVILSFCFDNNSRFWPCNMRPDRHPRRQRR